MIRFAMEQHPVPQNVTSFEFHLIGDMTLKQFGYLGSGVLTAYLTFVFILPVAPIVAIPIIVVSALLGVAFAFIPIQDRPLDHWASAFLKAVYSPTQGGWRPPFKTQGEYNPDQDSFFKNRLQLFLSKAGLITLPNNPTPLPIPHLSQNPRLKPLNSLLYSASKPSAPVAAPTSTVAAAAPPPPPVNPAPAVTPTHPLPSSEELNKTVEIAKQTQLLQSRIRDTQQQISHLKATSQAFGNKSTTYEQQLQQLFNELQSMIKKTEDLYHQAQMDNNAPSAPAPVTVAPTVKVIAPPVDKKPQILLTSLPNVINGIVTDVAGNYLEGVIVIIHNKDNLPVRALKTNKLGQFTGSTPLPSGVYTISLEKDSLQFDTLQISLEGNVMPPLTIAARKGGSTSA